MQNSGSKCNTLIWTDDAKKIGELSSLDPEKNQADAQETVPPGEKDLLTLIASKKIPAEKELYVRRIAWWSANDAVRMNTDTKVIFSPAQKQNMKTLAKLLDAQIPDQRIMKAEIMRELGEFAECINLLQYKFEKKYHNKAATFITKLAEQKIVSVRELMLN